MVSWDVDAIDPNDMPCTIAQDPDGLSAEDCISLADAVAETQCLVSMDVVEFNPELWGGCT
jgi:arginase